MTAAFWSRFKRFLLSGTYELPGVFGDLPFASGSRCLRGAEVAQAGLAAASGDVTPRSRARDRSTFTPGPIVDAITTERRYRPFAADGLARISSSMIAW